MKMSGMFSRKTYLACALAMAMLPLSVQAEVQGEVQAKNGTYVYDIPLGNNDITRNIVGETISVEFSLGELYDGVIFCPLADITSLSPVYYSATASLTRVDSEYMALNEYFDVKVEIYIDGNEKTNHAVPFENISNKLTAHTCRNGKQETLINQFGSGGKGVVTFRIKKPLVNGIDLRGTEVAQLFGSVVSGNRGNVPMATVRILSGVITVPDKCIIDDGSPVNVDFETIGNRSDKLRGDSHVVSRDLKIQCEGGSFTESSFDNIKLAIVPGNGVASFNSDYLATTGTSDRRDLGIVIRERTSGTTIKPLTFYEIPGFSNNQGTWNLEFAPVANQSSIAIPEGDFQSSATIVAQFP